MPNRRPILNFERTDVSRRPNSLSKVVIRDELRPRTFVTDSNVPGALGCGLHKVRAPGVASAVQSARVWHMALTAGSCLGPYEVLAPLGAGGMGEVYRARAPRLGREVAVKVLPEAFSRDSVAL